LFNIAGSFENHTGNPVAANAYDIRMAKQLPNAPACAPVLNAHPVEISPGIGAKVSI
jgi:hypothetical protein